MISSRPLLSTRADVGAPRRVAPRLLQTRTRPLLREGRREKGGGESGERLNRSGKASSKERRKRKIEKSEERERERERERGKKKTSTSSLLLSILSLLFLVVTRNCFFLPSFFSSFFPPAVFLCFSREQALLESSEEKQRATTKTTTAKANGLRPDCFAGRRLRRRRRPRGRARGRCRRGPGLGRRPPLRQPGAFCGGEGGSDRGRASSCRDEPGRPGRADWTSMRWSCLFFFLSETVGRANLTSDDDVSIAFCPVAPKPPDHRFSFPPHSSALKCRARVLDWESLAESVPHGDPGRLASLKKKERENAKRRACEQEKKEETRRRFFSLSLFTTVSPPPLPLSLSLPPPRPQIKK